ncbi:MAG: RNA ligase [bacterium]|nr:RNA ligase [bacterium]
MKQLRQIEHYSYEKISEDFRKWNLTEKDYRQFNKTDWVVTEKIHGANFCVHSNGKKIEFAKRKELLSGNEDFFGYGTLKKTLLPKIENLFPILKEKNNTIAQISVYGELFGGEYPHPGVRPNSTVQAVQTGIYYSPNIEFSIFDIACIHDSGEKNYLDFNIFEQICIEFELFYSRALYTGSYEKALAYETGFRSTIPALLGFPEIGGFDNKAEGIVIKPYNNFYIKTQKGLMRPVLKIKIPQFSEDKRFQQAQKWTSSAAEPQKSNHADININEHFFKTNVLPLITKERLNSAISKTGRLTSKNKNKILKELTQDIQETLNDNLNNGYSSLKPAEKEQIDERIGKESAVLIKKIKK